LLDLGRAQAAIELVEHALAHEPDDPELLDVLACAQIEVDPRRAQVSAARLAGVDPGGHRGYLLGSIAVLQLGYVQEAIRLAQTAALNAPSHAPCHAHLAQALARDARQLDRGRASARTALELAPNSALSHVAAGNVELHAGRRPAARRHYRRALELDPTNTTAQMNLAVIGGVERDVGGTLQSLQALLALEPNEAGARDLFDHFFQNAVIDLLWVVTFAALILSGILH